MFSNYIPYCRAPLCLCDPPCCGCLAAKCCAVFHGPLDMPRFLETKCRKKFILRCKPKFANIYTSMKFLLVIYTESVVVSCFMCVCFINMKILLCLSVCVCVCVCVWGVGLLSSSLPPHRSGYSSATFIFHSFVYSIYHSHMWK